jgi:hypothetical protein
MNNILRDQTRIIQVSRIVEAGAKENPIVISKDNKKQVSLYAMIDLFEKRIIVEFNPNQLMSVISPRLYQWLISNENQVKLCIRN